MQIELNTELCVFTLCDSAPNYACDQRLTVISDGTGAFRTAVDGSQLARRRILDWFHIAIIFRAAQGEMDSGTASKPGAPVAASQTGALDFAVPGIPAARLSMMVACCRAGDVGFYPTTFRSD
jgi:hypothetical protein